MCDVCVVCCCVCGLAIIYVPAYRYLEHSLLALDVGSDVTKSHMTPVVSQLSQQLSSLEQTFVSTPSLATPTLTKLVKRLKMMAQHLTAQ